MQYPCIVEQADLVHVQRLAKLPGLGQSSDSCVPQFTEHAGTATELAGAVRVLAAIDALKAGVNAVHIIDGGLKHSILLEVFTDSGICTMIVR